MKLMDIIKTPLRYPGGKTKALTKILPKILSQSFSEYREPFVGGGSVFLKVKQLRPESKYWINDFDYNLYCFWKSLQVNSLKFMTDIRRIKLTNTNAKDSFNQFKELIFQSNNTPDIWDRGLAFYFLNRTAFSGNVFSGGYSQESYEKRLTLSSINSLVPFSDFLKDVKITDYSYEVLLMKDGKDVFIFLDPPYYSAKESKLYGKDGKLHTHFDHEQFAMDMYECKQHKWLITYDNSEKIRDLFKEFSFVYTEAWELQYGVNNHKMNNAKKGKEIFISNFELSIE